MSTINAPNIFHPTWKIVGQWLARHAYIADSLSPQKAFAFLQLDHRIMPILFPIKVILRIDRFFNRFLNDKIIKQTRKKYNWK